MSKQEPDVQISTTALDACLEDASRPYAYVAVDGASRQLISVKIYDGVTQQNTSDFINSIKELSSGSTLEK